MPCWLFTFRSELGCGLFPESQSKAQGYGFPPLRDAALPRDALAMVRIVLRVLRTHLYMCDCILHCKPVMCVEISVSQRSGIARVLTATWVIYKTNCSLIGTLL